MSEFIDKHYVYKARLIRVVDGDTYDLHVDLGFHMYMKSRFRLYGHDTPELRRGTEFEKAEGARAKEFVRCWFNARPSFYIHTYKSDSFGRWLVDIFTEHDNLGHDLSKQHLATQWPVRWREVYDDTED